MPWMKLFSEASNDGPPRVVNISINASMTDPQVDDQPTSWLRQHSEIITIEVTFSKPVLVDVDALRLTNLGGDAPVDADQAVSLTPDHMDLNERVLTLAFEAAELGDGVFQLEILPTLEDLDGNALDGDGDGAGGDPYLLRGDEINKFYELAGDWNGDGGVSIFDFPMFAFWFGQSAPPAPQYMDLLPDGGISIFDFPVFANNFGVGVTYPTALVSQSLVATPLLFPARDEPTRLDNKPSRVMEHPLDRPLAGREFPSVEFRRRGDGAQVLETSAELTDLEELLDEIGADVCSAWNQLRFKFGREWVAVELFR